MRNNIVTCQICGKQFTPDHPNRSHTHTCSVECRGKLKSRQSPKVKLMCENCGKTFERYPSKIKNGRCFCNKKCWGEFWTNNASGWINSAGYRYICVDGREVFEHRYVMECSVGRALFDNEVVHHINGNRLDNRIENLQLMTRADHTTHHDKGKSRKGQRHPGLTEETKRRISIAKRGTVMSDETKAKISETMKLVRAKQKWSSKK